MAGWGEGHLTSGTKSERVSPSGPLCCCHQRTNLKGTSVGEDVEGLGPLCLAGGNVSAAAAVGNSREVPQRMKAGVTLGSRDSASECALRGTESPTETDICTPLFTAASR